MEEIRCERKVKAGRGVRPNVLDITMGQCIFCPHCNGVDVEPIEEMQSPLGTEGVWKCSECSGQFIIRRKTLLVWSEGMGPRASSPARGDRAAGQVIDASGKSSKTLRRERGLDSQVRPKGRAEDARQRRKENMSTRAMICVDRFGHEHFELFYRHCDGYPTGLGRELIEAMLGHDAIEEVIEAVGAEKTGKFTADIDDVFPRVQGDLEWMYVIRNADNSQTRSLQVFKTSFPYTKRNFVWPVWFCYRSYMKKQTPKEMKHVEHTGDAILHALHAFEKAGTPRERPPGPSGFMPFPARGAARLSPLVGGAVR